MGEGYPVQSGEDEALKARYRAVEDARWGYAAHVEREAQEAWESMSDEEAAEREER